jgi:hypothetical protein
MSPPAAITGGNEQLFKDADIDDVEYEMNVFSNRCIVRPLRGL